MLDRFSATLRGRELDGYQFAAAPFFLDVTLDVLACLRVAANDYRDCPLGGARLHNRCANPFRAPRDDHHFISELQVHCLTSKVTESAVERTIHSGDESRLIRA